MKEYVNFIPFLKAHFAVPKKKNWFSHVAHTTQMSYEHSSFIGEFSLFLLILEYQIKTFKIWHCNINLLHPN